MEIVKPRSATLLPPAQGVCPICAVDHQPEKPHNQESLYYKYRFFAAHGRWPTWADAIAHCSPILRAFWEEKLREHDAWSEPECGSVIADPPAESICRPIELDEHKESPVEKPPVRLAMRAGRCTDCGNRYYGQMYVARVNGRFVCDPCAKGYERNANGKWVLRQRGGTA